MKYRGVAYYPEYWPEARWDEDIRLMREAHINLVRVGEFAWTPMEPAEGQYTLDWLHRLVGKMGEAGISVLLCTPTATPPAWLTDQYPEVLLVQENGQRAEHGRRRHYCPTNATYRTFSRQITEVLSREFRVYPHVLWQLDNEFGPEYAQCYCEHCQAQFRSWLRQRYGTLEELNRRWATRFWSMEFTAWEQVCLGKKDYYSATLLDSRRFWSHAFVDFAHEQARIIRANHPGAFVTTNGMGPLFEPINYYDLFAELDVAPDDLYFDIATMDGNAMALDLYRNYKENTPFWITETGSGALSADKVPAPGMIRAWAFSALARGCAGYNIFRWRTCLSGQEQELQGVLEYSGKPRRRYQAVQQLYGDLEALWPQLENTPLPRAAVAMIHDYAVFWGYKSSRIDVHVDYYKTFQAVYQTFYDRNVLVDIIPPERDLTKYRVVVLPSLCLVDAAFAEKLRAFVAAGGTVLSLPQLACRDDNDNYLPACPPVGLHDLFGLRVESGTYLRNFTGPDQALWVPQPLFTDETPAVSLTLAAGTVTGVTRSWMEDLELESGTALGTFTDNDFAGCPFLVEHHYGAGRTLYCAAYPTPELLGAIVEDALAGAGVALGPATPAYVEVVRREPYTFIINHRREPVTLAVTGTPLVGECDNGEATLPPFGVLVLQEATVIVPA